MVKAKCAKYITRFQSNQFELLGMVMVWWFMGGQISSVAGRRLEATFGRRESSIIRCGEEIASSRFVGSGRRREILFSGGTFVRSLLRYLFRLSLTHEGAAVCDIFPCLEQQW